MSETLQSLFDLLEPLYQGHPAWPVERDRIAAAVSAAAGTRSPTLRALDADRAAHPAWFGAPDMVGYSFYVDRFAATLAGLRQRLPWLEALGIRLLHPLPMTLGQSEHSDGGFGWPELGPYNAILSAAAPRVVPPELLAQLAPNGVLIIPVGGEEQELHLIMRDGDSDNFVTQIMEPVKFVPLVSGVDRGLVT